MFTGTHSSEVQEPHPGNLRARGESGQSPKNRIVNTCYCKEMHATLPHFFLIFVL